MKRRLHKALSLLLTAVIVLNIGFTPAFAAEITQPDTGSLCGHHGEHTEDCGYKQETPCNHTHNEECYTKELTCAITEVIAQEAATGDEVVSDGEEAAGGEGAVDGEEAADGVFVPAGEAHIHGENCYILTEQCKHVHDETCGYSEGSPCTFDPANCTLCSPADKPTEEVCICEPAISAGEAGHDEGCPLYEEPLCTCPPVDSGNLPQGELVHGKECPRYTAPEQSEAVNALFAMVDALPGAADITNDNREAVMPDFEAALMAYEALIPEDKTAFEATKQYEKLMALHTVLFTLSPMSNEATWNMVNGDLNLDSSCAPNCIHTVSGTSSGGKITVNGGTHNITLSDVTIELERSIAFEIKGRATVYMTLEGENKLKSGSEGASLQVTNGNALTITAESTGNLIAASPGFGNAGIGGGQFGAGGNITISGGTITANANTYGAGIGGGNQGEGGNIAISGGTISTTSHDNGTGIGGGSGKAAGTITISGGTIITAASRSDTISTTGIGCGNNGGAGGNITIDGNAVIYANGKYKHINVGEGAAAGTVTKTRGVVFEGTSGTVYGSVKLEQNATVEAAHTLTIGSGKALEIGSGLTFTNNGTILLDGTLNGEGTLAGTGAFKAFIQPGDIAAIGDQVYTGEAITPDVTLNTRTVMGKVFTINTTGYTKSYENNTNVGTGMAKVIFTKDSDSNVKVEQTFNIIKSASALGLTTNKTNNAVTYGDTITFTANVSIPTTKARSATTNTVDFYYNGTKPNTSSISLTESGGAGSAQFTYQTTDKTIPVGKDIVITAEYGGSSNLNGVEQTIKITLNKKVLTGGIITPGQGKPYDGNNRFSNIAATFTAANGVLGRDTVTAKVEGTTTDSNASSSPKSISLTSARLEGTDADFYLPPADLAGITGSVAITRIDPTITVESSKSSDLPGKDIRITVKIKNPEGATAGFPAAGAITLTATNAAEKAALSGSDGTYTATYTLEGDTPGARASFKAVIPSETQNYNANTTGATTEVQILYKYTPKVILEADDTNPTYGEIVTLTATVDKDGKTNPLAGTVQFKKSGVDFGEPVPIDENDRAALSVDKTTLTVNGGIAHSFTAEFLPKSDCDYNGAASAAATVSVSKADMRGNVTINGTAKYGETLTADTDTLSALDGDDLGSFTYRWQRGDSAIGSNGTYEIQEEDIGKAITVIVESQNPNYNSNTSTTTTPEKADSTLTITGNPAKIYDGFAAAEPVTTQAGSTGTVTFEWYKGAALLDAAPKDAGNYTVKAILAASATHAAASATKDFVISKAPVTPVIDTILAQDYTGSQITPTVTVNSSVGGTTLSADDYTVVYGTNVDAGSGHVTVKEAVGGNYSFTDVPADFIINKIEYTGTAITGTKLVVENKAQTGAAFDLSALSFPVGFKNIIFGAAGYRANTDGVLTGTPGITGTTLTFDVGSVVKDKSGIIDIVVSSKNYLDYTVKITVTTVHKTPVTITGTSATGLIYNGSAQQGYTTISVEDDKVPVSELIFAYTGTAKDGTAYNGTDAPTKAGDYKLVLSINENDEAYSGTSSDILFSIGQKEIIVKAENQTMTKGGTLPAFTVNISGLVAPDTAASAFTTQPLAVCAADGNMAGTFDITIDTEAVLNDTVGANYTVKSREKGTLTVHELLYTVTIDGGGSGAGDYAPGTTVSIHAGDKSGYTFNGWTAFPAVAFADASSAGTSFVMPAGNVTITSNWSEKGDVGSDNGGGGGSAGSGSSTGSGNITPPVIFKGPSVAETNAIIISDKDGNITAAADDKDILKAIGKAEKAGKQNGIAITLNVPLKEDTGYLEIILSEAAITALRTAGVTQFTINNGLTTLTFDLIALNALSGGEVKLTIRKVDVKTLSPEARKAIGSRPVFRFGATVGGKAVTDFKGGRVGLQMKYTRTAAEQAGNLCGVYVDATGKVNWLEASSFDPITNMMVASTPHFSIYGVGYKQSTQKFTDVKTHWAKNDIDFVAARGLVTGTSATTFAPDQSMTRGMFVTALGKLAGVDTKKYSKTKFTDVAANADYAPYAAWASENNIVKGTSATTFSPNEAITRQEMAVSMVNYSKATGYKLPRVLAEVTFTDANSIASWAKDAVKQTQMAGILPGKSGNRFDPTATATRAEVSAALRRYVELVVSIETAEGFTMNESGQGMYIKDGKRMIAFGVSPGNTWQL